VEEVDVPLLGAVVLLEEVPGSAIGGGDLGAAILAQVVEGVLVHLAGGDVMDDVARLDPLVVAAQPGVELGFLSSLKAKFELALDHATTVSVVRYIA
jgi:hypothetical protein